MAALTGPSRSTQHDGHVTIEVPLSGPYGFQLEAGKNGQCAQIVGWERLPGGKFGVVQKHGGVRIHDYLLRVNEFDCVAAPFAQVVDQLRDSNQLRKVLTFGSPAKFQQVLHAKMSGGSKSRLGGDAESFGYLFLSAVRQARVNTSGREPFAEYEVVCKLRLATNKVQKESTLRWSVWRRFREFEALDAALRRQLGWQMGQCAFPPKNTFTFNKLALDFIETRRAQLDQYWQGIMAIERVTDFHLKHHCSPELRDFLEVSSMLRQGQSQTPPPPSSQSADSHDVPPADGANAANGAGAATASDGHGVVADDGHTGSASSASAPTNHSASGRRPGKRGSTMSKRKQTLGAARRASVKTIRPVVSATPAIEAAPPQDAAPQPASAPASQHAVPTAQPPPPPPPAGRPPPPPPKASAPAPVSARPNPMGGGGGGRGALLASINARRQE